MRHHQPPAERRLRSLCIALLVLDLAYCGLGLFVEALPGWKMFTEPAGSGWQVLDEQGRVVELRSHLPALVYSVDVHQAERITRFLCREQGASLLFYAAQDADPLWFSPPQCTGQRSHRLTTSGRAQQ